jgi:F-type H+-transporting ATPase subunit epsilon
MIVHLVSPEGTLYSGESDFIVAPAIDGQIGIMENHQPLLTSLKNGIVKIKVKNKMQEYPVTGGFLSIYSNDIEIAVDTAK